MYSLSGLNGFLTKEKYHSHILIKPCFFVHCFAVAFFGEEGDLWWCFLFLDSFRPRSRSIIMLFIGPLGLTIREKDHQILSITMSSKTDIAEV